MKFILMVTWWSLVDARGDGIWLEYAYRSQCESVAASWTHQAQTWTDKVPLEIWCYPVRSQGE
jgi:hypothetical protein